MKSIKETVIREFSSQKVQQAYREMTRQGLWDSEERLFRKYFKHGSSILDIGCGSGRTTFPLMRMGYRVVAIDLTPAMLESAKELAREFRLKADFRLGDATQLEFRDRSFDNALFSFNGWDQIPGKANRLKALEEACRVLRPGGCFIFTSHIRGLDRFTPYWMKQWAKIRILKQLGWRVKEQEWGDRFFRRGSREDFENEQYIHIPPLRDVKGQIEEAGLTLGFNGYRSTLSEKDKGLESGDCMFFVCRRPALGDFSTNRPKTFK